MKLLDTYGELIEAKTDSKKYTPEYLEKIKEKYKGRPISDFAKGEDKGAYQRVAFLGKDFLKDFTKDMVRFDDDKWTLDEVKKYISKFNSTAEFKKDKNYKSIYYYIWSRHRGMWPELTSNLKKGFGMNTKTDNDVITQKIIDKVKDTNPEWDFTNVSYYFDSKGERFVNGMVCHKKDIDGNEHGISNDVFYQDINRFRRACWKCRRQQSKPRRYTDDELADEAKKYNKKYDFLKGSPKFYDNARKRGKDFLEKITSHMTPSGESSDKLIYVHEFYDSDGKPYAAYVGLTNDSKRRYKEHVTGLYDDKKTITTQVAKFLKDNLNYTHEYKELTDYVDFKTAVKLENEWENKYNEDGWIMLNVVKTGSLGSPYKVSNKEIRDKIKDCIESGMTLKEFMKKHANLYSTIINRKLNQPPHNYLDGLKRAYQEYINYSDDKLIDMSKSFKSIRQLEMANRRLYTELYKRNLIHKVRNILNSFNNNDEYYMEKVKEYKSLKEFYKDIGLYNKIYHRGLMPKVKEYFNEPIRDDNYYIDKAKESGTYNNLYYKNKNLYAILLKRGLLPKVKEILSESKLTFKNILKQL